MMLFINQYIATLVLRIDPAIDLRLAGFRFLKLNFYYRNNDNYDDKYQFTPVWAVPFQVGDEQWLYDGFIDWSSATPQTAANLHFTSQLKWNIKQHLGVSNNVYVGFEYTYWHNKFGINNIHENNLNLLFKYHF
jgi:nucleoside-specific outer membrane channel protein Tsx